jgi:putative transposase
VAEAACARERTGDAQVGVDFGLIDWANFDDGTTIDNPRWTRHAAGRLADLQRRRARKRRGSIRYRRLSRQIQQLHTQVANSRKDFVHKQTTALAQRCELVATEALQTSNMSRSARGSVAAPGRHVKQKAGLNREILSAGLALTHRMLAYKVTETGTRLHVSETRSLKPSQRCSQCWGVVPKALSQREHRCGCGCVLPRDQNSARVVLIDAFTPVHSPGTGEAARGIPLAAHAAKSNSVTRETPTTAVQA